jgi:putative multicomponent Na+:H+ antiporter subunit B
MDSYIYLITALLPLAAAMVIFQGNPYHALVIRGILGAIAALVYTVLGAPDVALTEALVGTLLAITLYAIAVRSSLVLRLGVLKDEIDETTGMKKVIDRLTAIFSPYHMRVELVPYPDRDDLDQALINKEIHATCTPHPEESLPYQTQVRLRRLYEIMQPQLSEISQITDLSNSEGKKS